jgi:hypothetical protein
MALQVIGFFCEDIREEKSGQLTLVGVLPDNISISKRPPDLPDTARHVIPKLAFYVRIHLSVDENIDPMAIKLVLADGQNIEMGMINAELIATSKRDAAKRGLPIAGIVNHAVIQGFQIPGPGMILGVVEMGGQRHTCAVLNVIQPTEESPQA